MPANVTSVFDSVPQSVSSDPFDLGVDVTPPKVTAVVAQVSPTTSVPLAPLNQDHSLFIIDLDTTAAVSVFDPNYVPSTNIQVVNPLPQPAPTVSSVTSEPAPSLTLENCLAAANVFSAFVFLFILGVIIQAAISLAAGIAIPTAIGFVGLLILSKKFPNVKPVFNWVWEQLQTLRAPRKQPETELVTVDRLPTQV